MYHSDDPVSDAERYWDDREEEEERKPVCDWCGRRIYEKYVRVNGNRMCFDCVFDLTEYTED